MIPWWSTEFPESDAQAVAAAVRERCISQGRITRRFEEALAERLGVPYVVCTTSGTTALTMALMAKGYPLYEAIQVPARTWIATAHAAMMASLNPRVVDVDERGVMGEHEGSALPVHFNGREAVVNAEDVEDACQAFPAPPRGLAACYSMSTAKILPTGQGGFVATRNEAFYRELKSLRTHDVEDAMVPQVLTWKRFGYNFRYTDLQASIGLQQLARLDERIGKIRDIHACYWMNGVYTETSKLPLYNELRHPEAERLRAHLRERGIEARPFYPGLHTAPYLQKARSYVEDIGGCYVPADSFPNAERWSSGLFLPSGPAQKLSDIELVCEAIHGFV